MGMDKQPENDKEDGYDDCEPENNQEQEDKEDNNGASDLSEGANGNSENSSHSHFQFPASYILVLTGLAIALVGVSVNQKDDTLKSDFLISPGSSVER